MAIKKEVKEELKKKFPGVTNRRINQIIIETQKRYGIIDRDDAAYVLGFDKGIKLPKYLEKEEVRRIQELIKNGPRIIESNKSNTSNLDTKDKVIVERSPYDYPLSKFDIDSELILDCKIQKPYRKAVSEAMLTLETRIRSTLSLPDTFTGASLITEAKKKGVFQRTVPAEEEGLYFLFMGAIKWLRNPSNHRKITYSKDDSIKMVLFADYLISLFDDLVNKRI